MVLPIITYVITNTISNNIALSLGMIGALSIVRFRHPVKSPLELVIYFALITVGISNQRANEMGNTTYNSYSCNYTFCEIISNIIKKFGKSFYNMSFNEGVSSNTIEIISKIKLSIIEKSEFLISSFNDNTEKKIIYRLNFENKKDLQVFKDSLNEKN